MSKAMHTPGPWDVEDPMGEKIGLSIVQSGLKTYEWEFIAMVCQSDEDEERMGRQRLISSEEQWANARLIAAAPELLNLVCQYRDDIHRPPSPDSKQRRLAAIEAVIAKATA